LPTTTFGTMRQDISRELGYVSFATTTNITTNNSIISTALADDYDQDDLFIGWFVLLRNDSDGSTSTNNGLVRRVTDYAKSTGTITVAGAVLGAEDEGINVELHRFHPDRITDHYNRARQVLYPYVGIVRDFQTIVTGQLQQKYTIPSTFRGGPLRVYLGTRPTADSIAENEITDPGFEDWTNATTPASWTKAGSGSTVNQEEETTSPKNYAVLEGSNSARLVSNTSDETTLLQTVTPKVAAERTEMNFSVWVYSAEITNVITARIDGNDGTAHGSTGWELLTASVGAHGETTTVPVGVAIATNGTAAASCYVDEAILVIGQSEPVDTGWEEVLNWRYIPPVAGAANGGVIEFPFRLREKARIRLLGSDLLSSASTDASTIELDSRWTELLYDEIRRQLYLEAANVGFAPGNSYFKQQANEYAAKVDEALATGKWLHVANPRIKVPDA
jgi:hypothetical protein